MNNDIISNELLCLALSRSPLHMPKLSEENEYETQT
jgi:hypothetical protein